MRPPAWPFKRAREAADDTTTMLLGLGLMAALVTVPLLGGNLGRLSHLRIKKAWLLWLALLAQIVIIELIPGADHTAMSVVHVATYLVAGGFLWVNRHVVGLPVLTAGAALNLAAIIANAGTMPARPGALETAGLAQESGFVNSGVVGDPQLAILGDYFATPAWFPAANVFSVGDVLIIVGAAILLHVACGTRLVPRHLRWAPRAEAAPAT